MYIFKALAVALLLGAAIAAAKPYDKEEPIKASCIFVNQTIEGTINLRQRSQSEPVNIRGELEGLSPGLHELHVNTYGDLSDGCRATGDHYNPFNKKHGAPGADIRHAGDLGNIEADESGKAVFDIPDADLELSGHYSVIGRSMMVHAGQGDTEASRQYGQAGPRLACCKIKRVSKPRFQARTFEFDDIF